MSSRSSAATAHHAWAGMEPPAEFRYAPVVVEARGDLACFTRPELNSERVSYPIMTPPAAIGLLSAVFWKPQFRYVVESIEALTPVRWFSLRRNESESAITAESISKGMLDVRTQQRMTTALRDVHYRIRAHVWVHPEAEEQDPAKYRAQLTRRVERGQTFRQPFLGMREFVADVEPDSSTPALESWSEELGIMSHSITYDDATAKETYDWFEARVENGRMTVPRLGLLAQHNAGGAP